MASPSPHPRGYRWPLPVPVVPAVLSIHRSVPTAYSLVMSLGELGMSGYGLRGYRRATANVANRYGVQHTAQGEWVEVNDGNELS